MLVIAHWELLAFMGIGQTELLVFLIIVMVLFGGARIPQLARSLGKSITEFKKGVAGIDEEKTDDSGEPNKDKDKA